MTDIRYYRGKVKMKIISFHKSKALVQYLDFGIVGPKDLRKSVMPGMRDITLSRHCWRNRK